MGQPKQANQYDFNAPTLSKDEVRWFLKEKVKPVYERDKSCTILLCSLDLYESIILNMEETSDDGSPCLRLIWNGECCGRRMSWTLTTEDGYERFKTECDRLLKV